METPAPRARLTYLLVAAGAFALDQAAKWLAAHALALGESRRIVPGLFDLTHWQNRGAAFGLFADAASPAAQIFLVAFSGAALALVGGLLWRGPATRLSGWGLGLILGGALGNLVDRLHRGSVVDFLDFHLGPYHWPAFNLADSAIVLGAAALMFEILWGRRRGAPEA